MEDLSRCWQIPCIGQFVSTFQYAFGLPAMDLEELEDCLVNKSDASVELLLQIVIPLLQACCKNQNISVADYDLFLVKFLESKWSKAKLKQFSLSYLKPFLNLATPTKIEILFSLCHYRLDCNDIPIRMKEIDADSLRVQSLGSDAIGNVYWYFYGTRLYKEEPSSRRKKNCDDGKRNGKRQSYLNLDSRSRWSVVCTTLKDWNVFAQKFRNSKSKCEVALYSIITNNFLPSLSELYRVKEERMKKKLMDANELKYPEEKEDEVSDCQSPVDEHEMTENEEDAPKKRKRSLSNSTRRRKSARIQDISEKIVQQEVDNIMLGVGNFSQESLDKPKYNELTRQPRIVRKLQQLLTRMKLHKDFWPFLKAVEENVAPAYHNIVQSPIDLSYIERKIRLKAYQTVKQIDDDFQRLLYNCRLYNGAKHGLTELAKNLLQMFRESFAEDSSESSTNEVQQPSKTTTTDSEKEADKPSRKRRRKSSKFKLTSVKKSKVRQSTMEGLNKLAEASELAQKESSISEAELFVPDNQLTYKSKAYSELKIVPIKNHPPSFLKKFSASSSSCSDSDVNPRAVSSPPSSHRCVTTPKECRDIEQQQSNVSPDSRNDISNIRSPCGHSACSDRLSGSESANELIKNMNAFDDIPAMPANSPKSDTLSNFSSVVSSMIQESQVLPEISDLSCANNYQERIAQPTEQDSIRPLYSEEHSRPQQLNPVHLAGLSPLNNITTVDASILGLTSGSSSCNGNSPVGVPDLCSCPPASHSSPPHYRARIDEDGLLHDATHEDHTSLTQSRSLSEDETLRATQSILPSGPSPKSMPCSPDSQMPQISTPEDTVPRISPTLPPFSNYSGFPLQPPYLPPVSLESSTASTMGVDNDPCRSGAHPLPLQIPISTASFFFNQSANLPVSFPMSSTCGPLPTLSTALSHQFLRSATNGGMNVVSAANSPIISSSSWVTPAPIQIVKAVDSVRGNVDERPSNSPKQRRRKRCVTPKQTIRQSSHIVPRLQMLLPQPCCPNGESHHHPIHHSLESSPHSSDKNVEDPIVTSSAMGSAVPKGLSMPVFSPYHFNGSMQNAKLPPVSSVGSSIGHEMHPTSNFTTIMHPMPLPPILTPHPPVSTIGSSSNCFSVFCNTLPSMSTTTSSEFSKNLESIPVPQYVNGNAEKNFIMPHISQNSAFSSVPVVYAMSNSSPNGLSLSRESSPKELLELPAHSIQPFMFQGVPPRPQNFSDVMPQQLRHPHYMNLSSYLVPPSMLSSSLVPISTIGLPGGLSPTQPLVETPQAQSKTAPVYTILQNVPVRPH